MMTEQVLFERGNCRYKQKTENVNRDPFLDRDFSKEYEKWLDKNADRMHNETIAQDRNERGLES